MTEYELAVSRLEKRRPSDKNFICPCHDDKIGSLSVKNSDGKALIYCFAGCKYEDIIETLGLKKNHEKPELKEVCRYDYTDAEGNLIYQVVRFEPKTFKQCKANGTWGLNGIKPTLYHLPEVIEAVENRHLIFIVEGEKDVETLRKYDLTATTISGGANSSWQPEHISLLHHALVIIIPDNDQAGKENATKLANLLYGWCDLLKVIALPVKVKCDVTDYLKDYSIDDLMKIISGTFDYTPIGAITREEFHALKGHIIYLNGLINTIKQSTKKKQYNEYT